MCVLKDLASGQLPLASRADLEALPPGMDGFYRDAFERRFPSEESYGPVGELLGVMCEQREPLARRELAAILGSPERRLAESLRPLHDLLRLQTAALAEEEHTGREEASAREGVKAKAVLHSFDHLSLPQWLSEEDDYGYPRAGRFAVDRPAAAERIRLGFGGGGSGSRPPLALPGAPPRQPSDGGGAAGGAGGAAGGIPLAGCAPAAGGNQRGVGRFCPCRPEPRPGTAGLATSSWPPSSWRGSRMMAAR